MAKVDKQVVVQHSAVQVSQAWPQLAETLSLLPPYVALRSVELQVDAGGDKADALRVLFKGHSYVQ